MALDVDYLSVRKKTNKGPKRSKNISIPNQASAPSAAQSPPLARRLIVSPVEAEKRFSEAFLDLQKSKKFSEISHRKLGEFWSTDWVRAPFEEDLTLKQLISLPPRSIIGKHSFNQHKLENILRVIHKIVETPQQEAPQQELPKENKIIEKSQFIPSQITDPSFETLATLAGVKPLTYHEAFRDSSWGKVAMVIYSELKKQQRPHPLSLDNSSEILLNIKEQITSSTSELASLFEISLSAPALDPTALIPKSLRDSELQESAALVSRIITAAFGGREIVIQDIPSGIYSKDSFLLDELIKMHGARIESTQAEAAQQETVIPSVLSKLMGTLNDSQIRMLLEHY